MSQAVIPNVYSCAKYTGGCMLMWQVGVTFNTPMLEMSYTSILLKCDKNVFKLFLVSNGKLFRLSKPFKIVLASWL